MSTMQIPMNAQRPSTLPTCGGRRAATLGASARRTRETWQGTSAAAAVIAGTKGHVGFIPTDVPGISAWRPPTS